MATYLLAWNPKRWHWADLAARSQAVKAGRRVVLRWGCGTSRQIVKGDRAFLIRLGLAPKGIMASGLITRGSFADLHWEEGKAVRGALSHSVLFQLDTLLDPATDAILPRDLLNLPPFSDMHWDTRMSGVRIPDPIAKELEHVWAHFATIAACPKTTASRRRRPTNSAAANTPKPTSG